jgi:hypothetical protein
VRSENSEMNNNSFCLKDNAWSNEYLFNNVQDLSSSKILIMAVS